MIRANPLAALGLVLAAGGCNSFDEPSEVGPNEPVLVIPTDQRPAVRAEDPPPPISGGTLAVASDGTLAVAADPDRDRIVLVDLEQRAVRDTIQLEAGDEPGRVVLDGSSRGYVSLRGGGGVAVVDLVASRIVERLTVCSEPRGLALAPGGEALHVACAGGELVTLPTSGDAPARRLELGPDLRDVVVAGDNLMVSRFRSAEIVRVDALGNVAGARTPRAVDTVVLREVRNGNEVHLEDQEQRLTPSVAWRMVSNGQGGVTVLHQRGFEGELEISEPADAGSSPYGGSDGGGCGAIVQPAVTQFTADDVEQASMPISSVALGVDVAVSPNSGRIAIANAGLADPETPKTRTVFLDDDVAISEPDFGPVAGPGSIKVFEPFELTTLSSDPEFGGQCAFGSSANPTDQPVVAVAWAPDDTLIAQAREPSQLIVIQQPPLGGTSVIDLGGRSVLDTGHELFHRDSSAGLACASCHPEGREDGRVWEFGGVGKRRTQPLDIGLAGTQPFHWSGDLPGLSHLMDEVFVSRMGGVLQSRDRMATLERWLFARKPLTPIRESDDPAVERGRVLFESIGTGCTTCHQGDKLTHSGSFLVRESSESFQVPSLLGVGYRAPFMHDGCAPTLDARFDPDCGGGDMHGKTAHLGDDERADLVSYLESL